MLKEHWKEKHGRTESSVRKDLDSTPHFSFPICKPVFGLVSHITVREVKERRAKEAPWPFQCPRRQGRPWWKLMTQNEEDEDDSKDGGDCVSTEALVSTIRYRFPPWRQWPYSLFAQISWISRPALYNKFNYKVGTVKTLSVRMERDESENISMPRGVTWSISATSLAWFE